MRSLLGHEVHVPDTDTPLKPAPLDVSGKSVSGKGVPGKGTESGKGMMCAHGGVGILSNNDGKGVLGVFGGINTVNKAGDIAMGTAGDAEPSAPPLPPTRLALSSSVSAPAGTTVPQAVSLELEPCTVCTFNFPNVHTMCSMCGTPRPARSGGSPDVRNPGGVEEKRRKQRTLCVRCVLSALYAVCAVLCAVVCATRAAGTY